MRAFPFVALFAVTMGLCGCQNDAPASTDSTSAASKKKDGAATEFLKWSMDQHKSMKTFRAKSEWALQSDSVENFDVNAKRSIVYVRPNKFRLVSDGPVNLVSQSDGVEHVEYSSSGQGMKYPAPVTLGSSNSLQLSHPMFNGSLILPFFDGAEAFERLVDTSKPAPTFGADSKGPKGEALRTVEFTATGNFGNVQAAIDSKTGRVFEIRFDMAPVVEMMKEPGKPAATLNSVERFSNWEVDAAIPDSEIKVAVPKNVSFEEPGQPGAGERAAFKPGDKAPDISFTTLDGQRTKLSQLKGSVVLLDFWATWCGPCVEGLPITNKMHQEFASKGLKVVAISDEDVPTISNFVKSKGFTFTPYRDADRSANGAFKVNAIPTMVIVGKDGKIVSYTVGLEPEATLRSRLAAAGIK